MILGLGSDIIENKRIKRLVDRYQTRFLERVFSSIEQQKAEESAIPAATLAKRFAAKEAFAKALGTGFSEGLSWKDMEVINIKSGKPTLRLTGVAARALAEMAPEGFEAVVHVSLSDTKEFSQAVVIISADPRYEDA